MKIRFCIIWSDFEANLVTFDSNKNYPEQIYEIYRLVDLLFVHWIIIKIISTNVLVLTLFIIIFVLIFLCSFMFLCGINIDSIYYSSLEKINKTDSKFNNLAGCIDKITPLACQCLCDIKTLWKKRKYDEIIC